MKEIKDFNNYFISEQGFVYSKKTNTEIKAAICRGGYCNIRMYHNGKQHTRKLHRLVAEAFIDNAQNKKEVNHIDGNKLNNNINNLEWVTSKDNVQHSIKNGRWNGRLIKVVQKDKQGNIIADYNSIAEASRISGVHYSSILDCIRKRAKTGKGFVWIEK